MRLQQEDNFLGFLPNVSLWRQKDKETGLSIYIYGIYERVVVKEGESPAAARIADGNRRQGARVIASLRMMAPAPPEAELYKHKT